MSLVISRKVGERIFLSGGIILTVTHASFGKVILCIECPQNVRVEREEKLSEEEIYNSEQIARSKEYNAIHKDKPIRPSDKQDLCK